LHWSYSDLTNYESCPFKRKLKLDGCKEVQSEHATRGIELHRAVEATIKSGAPIPEELSRWEDRINEITHEGNFVVEELWGLTEDWKPCHWSKAWCRVKLDIALIGEYACTALDWKTGKKKPISNADQGNLYLLGLSAYYPNKSMYSYEFQYLNDTPLRGGPFKPQQVNRFKKNFERRVNKMFEDKAFNPRPSKKGCEFCGFNTMCPHSAYDPEESNGS